MLLLDSDESLSFHDMITYVNEYVLSCLTFRCRNTSLQLLLVTITDLLSPFQILINLPKMQSSFSILKKYLISRYPLRRVSFQWDSNFAIQAVTSSLNFNSAYC